MTDQEFLEKYGEIPTEVLVGLEAVRQGGKYNMWSGNQVFKELFDLGHYEAVTWLAKDESRYCENCEDDCDECHRNYVSVDSKKYAAALNELGKVNSIASILVGGN